MVKKLTFIVLTLVGVGLMIFFESLAIIHNNTHTSRAVGWEILTVACLFATAILATRTFFLLNQPRQLKTRRPLLPGNRVFWMK